MSRARPWLYQKCGVSRHPKGAHSGFPPVGVAAPTAYGQVHTGSKEQVPRCRFEGRKLLLPIVPLGTGVYLHSSSHIIPPQKLCSHSARTGAPTMPFDPRWLVLQVAQGFRQGSDAARGFQAHGSIAMSCQTCAVRRTQTQLVRVCC